MGKGSDCIKLITSFFKDVRWASERQNEEVKSTLGSFKDSVLTNYCNALPMILKSDRNSVM